MPKTLLAALLLLTALPALAGTAKYDPSPFAINGLGFFHGYKNPDPIKGNEGNAALIKEAGISWVRLDFWWGVVVPEKGRYEWAFPDKVIDFYISHNINPLPILCYSSAWSGGKPPLDDKERALFGDYVYECVKRYKGKVKCWEIWNEPNIPSFWKPQPSVAEYTKLLKVAYKRAKEADPNCTIVGGCPCLIDYKFIQGIIDNGGWDSMDVLSVHPYSMAGNPIEMDLKTQLAHLQRLMEATGKVKPVWTTEIGWKTNEGTPASDEEQAANLAKTYAISLAGGVEKTFWFCLNDWSEKWGIVRGDGTKKPSFEAYKLLSSKLKDATARFGAGRESYSEVVFTQPNGDEVMMVWANGDKPVEATLAYKATANRVTGEAVPITDGKFEIKSMPTLIFPVDGRVYGAGMVFASQRKKNLLVNGNLEREGGWNRGRHGGTRKEGKMEWAPAPGETTKVLQITEAKSGCWDSMPVPVYPGKRYTLTARIRTEKATGQNLIALAWWTPNGWGWVSADLSKSIAGDNGWTTLKATGIAPKDAGFVRADMVSEDNLTGKVWFDSIRLICDDEPYYW